MRWRARPGPRRCAPWALGALAVAVLLLVADLASIATVTTPDPTGVPASPACRARRELGDFGFVLYRNGLVLALHALRLRRRLHGRLVAAARSPRATAALALDPRQGRPAGDRLRASLRDDCSRSARQAYVLGGDASTSPAQLDVLARRCCSIGLALARRCRS